MLQTYHFSHYNAENLKAIQIISDMALEILSNKLKIATNLTGADCEISAILPLLNPNSKQFIMTLHDITTSLSGAGRPFVGFLVNSKYGFACIGCGFSNDGTDRVRTAYLSFIGGDAPTFTWLGSNITLDTSQPVTMKLVPIKTAETAGYTTPQVGFDITVLHNGTRETSSITGAGFKPYNLGFVIPAFGYNYISSDADYISIKSLEISTDMNYQMADI